MNGVDYSASIMVHIVHATFCTCALIKKMKHEERLQQRRDLYRQRRDRETEEERQGEVHAYVAICNLSND